MSVFYFIFSFVSSPAFHTVFFKITDEDRHGTTREKHEGDGNFRQVFFGRLVRSSKRLRESVI